MNKKYLIISALTVGVLGVTGYGLTHSVYAESANRYSPIVQKLIEKFNLNTSEVDKVIETERSERQADRQKNLEERLNQAVTNKEITEEQKAKILAKHEELKNSKENWENLTREERQAKMQEHRTNLEQWAKDNGIDIKYLMGMGECGKGMKGGEGRGFGNGMGNHQNSQN